MLSSTHFFSAALAALSLLVVSGCAVRPAQDSEPPISERAYADHSCADLAEAWRDMRDHEDQLSGEVARISSGPVDPAARPLRDRGHTQALGAVRAHMEAIRTRARNTACALPADSPVRN